MYAVICWAPLTNWPAALHMCPWEYQFVTIISKFLKRYLKAKHTRAPAYSRALQRIKGGFSRRVVKRSSGPIPRIPGGNRVVVKVDVVQMKRVNDQMGQGRSVWRDEILILKGRPGGWRIEETDEDDVLWLAMKVVEVKKWCGVQVVDHSKDEVQWWIWLGWITWDEKWPGVEKGETGWWSSRAGWLDGEEFAEVSGLGRLQGIVG